MNRFAPLFTRPDLQSVGSVHALEVELSAVWDELSLEKLCLS